MLYKLLILTTTAFLGGGQFTPAASIPGIGIEKTGPNQSEIVKPSVESPTVARQALDSQFAIFVPKKQTSNTIIDYGVWDEALSNVVLRLGQSIRERARRPNPEVGTRIVFGHKSAYRLEGSRVTFSYLNDEYKDGLTQYRKDLERIANTVDITRLSRNEQLAFWFNLHNVVVVEQIALQYPIKRPSELRVGENGRRLSEAKLLNIREIPVSLRDIRENIVFANWSNPDVIYGFFHGDIGSPALQNYAFTGSNVHQVLKIQAGEFVNSLRGFHESSSALKFSVLYEEAKPYFFTNWPDALKTHLGKHASPDVLEELAKNKPVKFDRYDPVVADLLAGDGSRTPNLNVRLDIAGRSDTSLISPGVARLLRELQQKTKTMRRRGMIMKRGTVTIEDVETIDVDIPPVTESPAPEE